MSHTPGPWGQAGKWVRSEKTFRGDKLLIATCELEDDARLIAAAPTLLAAAVELVGNTEYADEYNTTGLVKDCERLKAAVAKAKGTTP
jgi:hypothetical protein